MENHMQENLLFLNIKIPFFHVKLKGVLGYGVPDDKKSKTQTFKRTFCE
jgi:hypothetical protein